MRELQRSRIDALLDQRVEAGRAYFAAEAERLAELCHGMAERFARGETAYHLLWELVRPSSRAR